jgi:hypothetical protein
LLYVFAILIMALGGLIVYLLGEPPILHSPINLQPNLLIVAPKVCHKYLSDYKELKERAGFKVFIQSPFQKQPLKVDGGFCLLIGTPHKTKNKEWYLPTAKVRTHRVFTNRNLDTGFPKGLISVKYCSDGEYVKRYYGNLITGRWPVSNLKQLQMMIKKGMQEHSEVSPVFLLAEGGGFSVFIDSLIRVAIEVFIRFALPSKITFFADYYAGSKAKNRNSEEQMQNAQTLVMAGHGGSLFKRWKGLVNGVQNHPTRSLILGCQTGLSRYSFAETMILHDKGPVQVVFASGITHPVSDACFGLRLLTNVNLSSMGFSVLVNRVFLDLSQNRGVWDGVLDFLTNLAVDVEPSDSQKLRDDISINYNLYGDPTWGVKIMKKST